MVRAERVAPRGPVILVANHTSLLDGVLIHAVTWRPLRVLIAAEWADWAPFRPYFKLMGGIRVSREQKNHQAIDAALGVLERGDAIALFPEGGIQEDGELGPFRHGVAHLALRSGALVYPCGIVGAFESMPWPRLFPRPWRITVRCGRPLRLDAEQSRTQEPVAGERMEAGGGAGTGPGGRAGDGKPFAPEALAAATERIREAVRGLVALGH